MLTQAVANFPPGYSMEDASANSLKVYHIERVIFSPRFASKLGVVFYNTIKKIVINHKMVVFCLQIREIPKQTLETQL